MIPLNLSILLVVVDATVCFSHAKVILHSHPISGVPLRKETDLHINWLLTSAGAVSYLILSLAEDPNLEHSKTFISLSPVSRCISDWSESLTGLGSGTHMFLINYV